MTRARLHLAKTPALRRLARYLGVSVGGSRRDLIARVGRAMENNT